ncbi:hypothetical protein ACU4GR_25275 [Methylobacterium oryzae CBMB20]
MIHLINMTDWLDRAEVLDALGIRAQTLYAYVSRGLIEARQAPGRRHSQYRASDVATLADRRGRSRASAAIAAGAMAWGEPSVVTAISTVHRGSLIYRGRDAVAFARHASLEAAADLLWDSPEPTLFDVPAGAAATPFLALAGLLQGAEATLGRGHPRLCRDARAPSRISPAPAGSPRDGRPCISVSRGSGPSTPRPPTGSARRWCCWPTTS